MDKSKIYNYKDWRQRIEFEEGKITPGTHTLQWDDFGLPKDMTNKSFVEIGAYDGMYAFEAERRGADEVLAIDLWNVSDFDGSEYPHTPSKEGFNIMHEYLDSSVKSMSCDLMDITSINIGKFDVVLCMNTISWTNYPIWGLKNLSTITDKELFIRLPFHESDTKPELKMYGNPDLSSNDSIISAHKKRWLFNEKLIRHTLSGINSFQEVDLIEKNASANIMTPGRLKNPINIYNDYGMEKEIDQLNSGKYVRIRTKDEGKACIAWTDSSTGSVKVGWVWDDNLEIKEEGIITKQINSIQKIYDKAGIKKLYNKLKSIYYREHQQKYLIHAVR